MEVGFQLVYPGCDVSNVRGNCNSLMLKWQWMRGKIVGIQTSLLRSHLLSVHTMPFTIPNFILISSLFFSPACDACYWPSAFVQANNKGQIKYRYTWIISTTYVHCPAVNFENHLILYHDKYGLFDMIVLKVKCFSAQCSAALNSHLNTRLSPEGQSFYPLRQRLCLLSPAASFFSSLLIPLARTFNFQSMEEQNSSIKHKIIFHLHFWVVLIWFN